MAKTLRTSQNYTIQAGDGASGSHVIKLDSRDVRVTGNLVIDGDQVVLNTQTLSIEDPIIVLNRNTSSTVLSEWDSGILVNRGESNNAALYWDGADDVFKAVTTTSDGSGTEITETALSNIRVAEPTDNSDAATKNYVDNAITTGSMSEFYIVDQNGLNQTIQQADTITFASGQNTNTEVVTDGRVIINLDTDLSTVNSITASTSSTLVLGVDTDYNIVINNILSFASNLASDPLGTSPVTRLYAKTPAGGGTGLFFKNDNVNSGSADELISKKKATAIAIALG